MLTGNGVAKDEVYASARVSENSDSSASGSDSADAHTLVEDDATSSVTCKGFVFTTALSHHGEAFVFNPPGYPTRYSAFPVRQLLDTPTGVYAVVGGDVRSVVHGDVTTSLEYEGVEFGLSQLRPHKIEVDVSSDISTRVDVRDTSGWYTYHGNRVVQLGRGLRSSRLDITITMVGNSFTYYGAVVYGNNTNRMTR